ncbi:hypothetical protein Tco_0462956 [Tanacetum coccineum]
MTLTTNTLSNIALNRDTYNEVWKVIRMGLKEAVNQGKDGVYGFFSKPPQERNRRFNGMEDAKRFGQEGIKQSLEKGYDRFQKLLSQLDALGAGVSTPKDIHLLPRHLRMWLFYHKPKTLQASIRQATGSGSYSSYTTSSSIENKTATPGLAVIAYSFYAKMLLMWLWIITKDIWSIEMPDENQLNPLGSKEVIDIDVQTEEVQTNGDVLSIHLFCSILLNTTLEEVILAILKQSSPSDCSVKKRSFSDADDEKALDLSKDF